MKIAFIVGEFPTLSETFIINQAVGLIDRGHDVDIYADRADDLLKLHEDVIAYRLLEKTHYFSEMPENLFWRAVKGAGLFFSNFFRAPKATLRSLNFLAYGDQAISLWLLFSLLPDRLKDYDIVHCQFGTVAFRGLAFRIMNAPKAKLVTTFRGQDISYFVQRKGDSVYAPLFKQGDYFLANCEFFKARAVELGCNPERIRVHGSGLDCSRFPFQVRRYPESGRVRIATVGRLVEKKGIEYSIRAFAEVIKTHPNLEYLIIGDGPLRAHLEQLIESLGVEDTVQLVGRKSQAEIIALLETAHLFVAPSVTAANGDQDAPINVLKEAMAMGLPVISTLHGGIPELVEDGVSGFLVPERDADAIAQKLTYLIEHADAWPQMGRAGRAYVEAHYDLSGLNDRLVALYQSLIEPPPESSQTPSHTLLPTYTS